MHTLPLTPTVPVPVAVPFPVTVHSDNYACAMHNQRDKACSRLRMQIEQLKLTLCPSLANTRNIRAASLAQPGVRVGVVFLAILT